MNSPHPDPLPTRSSLGEGEDHGWCYHGVPLNCPAPRSSAGSKEFLFLGQITELQFE